MERIKLTYAKAHLNEVVDKVEAGLEVIITRRGKDVVRMSPARQRKQPIPLAELAEFRASMPRLRRPSVGLLREMRDEDY